ncbi:MAG: serine/threonine protein kinase [Christensenellales bacterium]|jgi:serine/threonine-protein kinase
MQFAIDGVAYQLGAPHDFSWLHDYGRVFAVFDRQDSGNIAFGVAGPEGKRFVKYAGAPTLRCPDDPAQAVARLRAAVQPYRDLRHPNLVHLRQEREVGAGYALIFDWVQGQCLHAHWDAAAHPEYTHPQSPYERYRRLPLNKRLNSLATILDVHAAVERAGYVAVDLYDGSLIYDFSTDATTVCDIDFYAPGPLINTMGRMWGSSRFMSPEEFTLGAAIDARSNVFSLGAMAFVFLGGGKNRDRALWEAGDALYGVMQRAMSPERDLRYPTVAALKAAFDQARA